MSTTFDASKYTTPPPAMGQGRHTGGLYLFKNQVPQAYPSGKKPVTGRLLPGYNWNLALSDQMFLSSWDRYRDVSKINPKTNQPEFTRFGLVVDIIRDVGLEGRDTFLANAGRGALLGCESLTPFDQKDAFRDVRMLAGKLAKTVGAMPNGLQRFSAGDFKKMTEAEGKQDRPLVPGVGQAVLFNIYAVTDKGAWENQVIRLSYAAYMSLVDDLDMFINPAEGSRDPNWPNYLYGDVTDPASGLRFTTCERQSGNARPHTGFQFSPIAKSRQGTVEVPVDANVLQNRTMLWDPDIYTTLTYQEQVEYMVEQTRIPYELIVEACSQWATVPDSNKRAGTSAHSNPPGGGSSYPGHAGVTTSAATFSPGGMGAPPPPPGAPAHAPAVPQFPPAGWALHTDPQYAAQGYWYCGQEVLLEEQLRARYGLLVPATPPPAPTPPPPAAAPAPAPVPSPPPMAAPVPAAAPQPAGPPIPATPVTSTPPPAAMSTGAPVPPPTSVPSPGVASVPPTTAPATTVPPSNLPPAPAPLPPAPAPAAPAPWSPPAGWALHTDPQYAAQGYWYCGQEVMLEQQLRERFPAAAAAAPAPAPSAPAPPPGAAPTGGGGGPADDPKVDQKLDPATAARYRSLWSRTIAGETLTTEEMNEFLEYQNRIDA